MVRFHRTPTYDNLHIYLKVNTEGRTLLAENVRINNGSVKYRGVSYSDIYPDQGTRREKMSPAWAKMKRVRKPFPRGVQLQIYYEGYLISFSWIVYLYKVFIVFLFLKWSASISKVYNYLTKVRAIICP